MNRALQLATRLDATMHTLHYSVHILVPTVVQASSKFHYILWESIIFNMNEILYVSMHLESSLFSWFVSLLNASYFLQLIR